jgi:CMP-N-acetylneuraminic acid synthetase
MFRALIPFRKGSKRIRDKNVKLFPTSVTGVPLVNYTIAQALKSQCFDKSSDSVILATDYDLNDFKYHNVIWDCSTKVSKLYYYSREIVDDDEPATVYIKNVINDLNIDREENIVLLQPTCPLRDYDDIDNAVRKYERLAKKTLVSAVKLDSINKLYTKNGLLGEASSLALKTEYDTLSKKDALYMRNSSIYIFNVGYFLDHNTIFSKYPGIYEMPMYRSIDIDTIEDWELAESIFKGGLIKWKF